MKDQIHSVYILGLGAMGSMYAEKLYEMSPDAVKIIASRDRITAFRRSGLTINGRPFSFSFVESGVKPADAAPADLILITVKSPQLEQAIREIRPFVGKDTLVLSLLNGISSEEIIAREIGHEHVLPAYGLGMDAVREGNTVRYANMGRIIFGEKSNETISEKVRVVKELFDRAKIPYHIPPDMEKALWMKFMMNTGINQASAVLRASYGIFQQEGEARRLMLAISGEVLALSRQIGIGLTDTDTTDFLRVLDSLHPAGKTSMLQDIEAGRRTEVELFAGTVLGLGKKYNVATPVNDVIYRIILAMEQQIKKEA